MNIFTEISAAQYDLELNKKLYELIFLLIGHRLTQDEIGFDPNHVDNTQKHRSKIMYYLVYLT